MRSRRSNLPQAKTPEHAVLARLTWLLPDGTTLQRRVALTGDVEWHRLQDWVEAGCAEPLRLELCVLAPGRAELLEVTKVREVYDAP